MPLAALGFTIVCALVSTSCGRQGPDASVEVRSESMSTSEMATALTPFRIPERDRAGVKKRTEEGAASVATPPDELDDILNAVNALAETNGLEAAEQATVALSGLGIVDDSRGDGEELNLSRKQVQAFVGLARHVFAGERAYGGGFVERLPEDVREAVTTGILREDIEDGDTEGIGDWIGGMRDHDTADLAKWEFVKILFMRFGAGEGFDHYPAELLRNGSDISQVRQRFSVLEAQQSAHP